MRTKKTVGKSTGKVQESYDRTTVSNLPRGSVLTVVCSDIHLCLNPPVFRSNEPSWLDAMTRPLMELEDLLTQFELSAAIYAGDIFDRWNSPPELINWALQMLPRGYAVPGQHDLPLHSYDDIQKSAYWTLVWAQELKNLEPNEVGRIGQNLFLQGFPWGSELHGREATEQDKVIAVVHRYCWKPKCHSIPNPSLDENYHKHQADLQGFDVSVFGDNHIGFISKDGKLINCGSLMVRNSDQRNYRPMVGLLLRKPLRFVPYYLDTSQDVYLESMSPESETILNGMQDFLDGLGGLASDGIDFVQALRKAMKKGEFSKVAKRIVNQTIEEVLAKQEKQK